jgi:hypothetical protein
MPSLYGHHKIGKKNKKKIKKEKPLLERGA